MWEEKEKHTKQQISGEFFRAEMIKDAKLLILPLIAAVIVFIVCAALMIPFIGSLKDAINEAQTAEGANVSLIVELVSTILVLLVAVGYPLWIIAQNTIFFIKISKRQYEIVEDTLMRKVDGEYVRIGMRSRYNDVFYFEKYGRYVVYRSERSAFDYSTETDRFYLIVLKGRKPKIMRVYNTKVYEYKT